MKIAHFADTHLGMTNFGRLDTTTGLDTRVLDYLDTLECMVEAMGHIKPDVILFAGDAFRTRSPTITLTTHYANIIQKMAAIAPIIAVLGNHDRQTKGSGKRHAIELWEELATTNQIIVAHDISCLYMDEADIITLPWFYDKTLDDVCDELDVAISQSNEHTPNILLGHVGVDGAEMSAGGVYQFISDIGYDFHMPLDIFADSQLWDYVALGHVHKHQCMCKDPPVVYSGSLERIDWGERHDAGKGFVVADVSQGSATWKFIDLQVPPMRDIRVPIDHIDRLEKEDVGGAIVRVTVVTDSRRRKFSPHSAVMEHLPDTYHWLDQIIIENADLIKEREARATPRVTSVMPPMEALRIYLEERHQDGDYVEKLMATAKDLIEGRQSDE